jgi:hypothetical protein
MYAIRSSSSLLRQRAKQRFVSVTNDKFKRESLHSGRPQLKKKSSDAAKNVISQKNAPPPAASNNPKATKPEAEVEFDPHAMASEMIKKSEGRMQGTEAIASMTPEQRMRNYVTAAALVGFATWVWWYSMQSVGRSKDSSGDGNDIERKLRSEAEDAVKSAETKTISEQEAEELAQLDLTLGNDDDDLVGDDVIVAVAAPDDVATSEEDINLAAQKNKSGGDSTTKRPLWKKVVFFWKKD